MSTTVGFNVEQDWMEWVPEQVRELTTPQEIGHLLCARLISTDVIGDPKPSPDEEPSLLVQIAQDGKALLIAGEEHTFGMATNRLVNVMRMVNAYDSKLLIPADTLRDYGSSPPLTTTPRSRRTAFQRSVALLTGLGLAESVPMEHSGSRYLQTYTMPDGVHFVDGPPVVKAPVTAKERPKRVARPAVQRTPAAPAEAEPVAVAPPDKTVSKYYDSEKTVTSDTVGDYLREIAKEPLLTAEEEVELAKQIEVGVLAIERLASLPAAGEPGYDPQLSRDLRFLIRSGKSAKDRFTRANLRLVVSIAKRYTGRGMELTELIQEGNLGLNRAIEKFDYEKGYKFSTYATWWLRQSISRAMADQSRTIRLPVHLVEDLNKLKRIKRDEQQRLSRDVRPEELAEAMGISVEKVIDLERVGKPIRSLDEPLSSDGDMTLGDLELGTATSGGYQEVDKALLRDGLESLMDGVLTEREKEIVLLRNGAVDGVERSLVWIGENRFGGMSRERVRQIEAKAMKKLKAKAKSSNHLRDFLD